MEALGIEGAWVFTPQVHRDDRGAFLEAFRGAEFAADLGYRLDVAQVNCSVSRRGVIRGIHYADVPPGQAKYVTCVAGAILDVVVDLRAGIARLRQVGGGATGRRGPPGGLPGRGPGARVPGPERQRDRALPLLDALRRPAGSTGSARSTPRSGSAGSLSRGDRPVLSDKDAAAPSLDEALRAGRLPRYADCVAYGGPAPRPNRPDRQAQKALIPNGPRVTTVRSAKS